MNTPKLKSLQVRDFRSISGEWRVPLDANVVLIHGQNGAGKTSLLSALELAATGAISYLERIGDSNYLKHLQHRGAPSAHVTLEVAGLGGQEVASIVASERGIVGDPLLDARLAEAFIERCFLPQATLGRLFELYGRSSGKGADTPLLRFVKEVLGLEALDALIDGLHLTGHIRRIEKLSLPWQEVESRLGLLKRRQREDTKQCQAVRDRLAGIEHELDRWVERQHGESQTAESVEARAREGIDQLHARESRVAMLHEAELRLDAVDSTLAESGLNTIDISEEPDISALAEAEARYRSWFHSQSEPIRFWYFESHPGEADPPEVDPVTMLRALRGRIAEVEDEAAVLRRTAAEIQEIEAEMQRVEVSADEVRSKIVALQAEREAASTSSAASGLAAILVSILNHVEGETCPVCDQDYLSEGTLANHILEKASNLDADAERLLALEDRFAGLEGELHSLNLRRDSLEARLGHLSLITDDLDRNLHDLTATAGHLRSLEPLGEVGVRFAAELEEQRRVAGMATQRDSLVTQCISDLNKIASALDVVSPAGLLVQRVASLRALVRSELDLHANARRELEELLRLRDVYFATRDELATHEAALAEREGSISVFDGQLEEARRRKEAASDLRKAAETLRASTVSRVFDDHLNAAWARIFAALVPSEPFVPQFKRTPGGGREVKVEIETVHRDGSGAATPAAMLSQGNLNTAALSLFVALHFAVPARLPWLIFDDPVQSMDDLHVTNFAAMVKQLSRRNGRQVVIAVHERELFDYLSVELAPGSPGEELLTTVLDRTYGKSVITSRRIGFKADKALSPTAAA